MINQLLIKKNYLLIAGTAIFLLLCYQLAFKKTLEAWQTNKQLQAKLAQAADLNYQPAYLERKNNNLGRIIDRYKTDTAAFRSNSISTIASIAEKEQVKLSEVPVQNPLFHSGQFTIQKLSFEGGFFALIKVVNQLQALKGIGMVRSVDFKTTETRSGSNLSKKLMVDVYLETAHI
jgi:hypothetical protein